ncbi:MAG: alpha/beta hydrolase [Gammaproteobacteria bacterium]
MTRARVLSVATALAVLWLAAAGLLYLFQEQMVFIPARRLVATPQALGLRYEDVRIEAGDEGISLHGWYVPAAVRAPTLLYLHGNAGNVSHRLVPLQVLHALGLNVLIIDYRGYGLSGGRPSEEGTYRDAAAAWAFLTLQRAIRPGRIVLYGESLGAAVAIWLANRYTPGAVLLEAPFTSLQEVARRHFPIFPAGLILHLHYPSLERIAALSCPILIIHSRSDEIVPIEQGLRLYAAASVKHKRFFERSGGHNDAFFLEPEPLAAAIRAFLNAQGLADESERRE